MADNNTKKVVHAHINTKKYKVTLNAGEHELIADEPVSVGGKNLGPDPYDYLLMALGSCTAMTVRMYADRKKWPLEEVFVELLHHKTHAEDCEDCDNKGSRIDHIEKELIVKGELSEQQKNRLLEISEKCPVNKTLQSDIKITSTLGG